MEAELNATTPDAYRKNAHHWLLLHGRYIYTARQPACPNCMIADLCEYADKTPPRLQPKPRPGPSRTARAIAKAARAAAKTRPLLAKR